MAERKLPPASEASRYLGPALGWALSVLLFLWLGTLGDRWLGTRPLLTLVGVFVGAGAGFYSMYYHLVIEPRRRGADRTMSERGEGGKRE